MTRLLLVGCTGSGRTTVGSVIAERTGWPFLDDDALLARTAGLPVQRLWAEQGPEAVLAAEAATVNLLLAVPGPLVASVASGILLHEEGRRRLGAGGHVVWLRAALPTLVRRVGGGEGRPWLLGDPPTTLARLVRQRYPCYEQVADRVVDVDALPVPHVVRAVLDGLPAELQPR